MVQEPEAQARFAELMSRDDPEIDLERVALTIALAEYPELDAEAYLRRLDQMAAELRPRLSPEESPARQVAVLNAYLFGEQAFHGSTTDYYDPRNSYLNQVLDRRRGIPITLSLVYIALGRRLGLSIEGVGMPGHFLVRYRAGREEVLVDPFNQGAVLTVADCAARLHAMYGQSLRFTPDLLHTTGQRDIVLRMLGNLKGCYLRLGDLRRALRAVDWTTRADPSRAESLRERGLLRYRLGDLKQAAADLERYLELDRDSMLARQTRSQLAYVRDLWIRRN